MLGRGLVDPCMVLSSMGGESALHRAVSNCLPDAVDAILRVANVSELPPDSRGQTPLVLVARQSAAAKKDGVGALTPAEQVRIAEALIPHDPHCVDREDGKTYTPLHHAAEFAATDLVELLLNNGADPNKLDGNNQSALHWAVRGQIELDTAAAPVIAMLLENNCDGDVRATPEPHFPEGATALELAQRPKNGKAARAVVAVVNALQGLPSGPPLPQTYRMHACNTASIRR